MATIQQKRDKAIKLVKSILIARRNNNIKAEQSGYEQFTEFCERNDLDFQVTFDGARAILCKSIANQMNGFC